MLPPHLLGPRPGDKILDMCAAPGGKTTHIAALADNKAAITAGDISPWRLRKVLENAERLGAKGIQPVCMSGMQPAVKGVFNRVLLDAPCSGLGTLRRHPDIKLRIRQEDIEELAAIQASLLRSAIDLCENSGVIVYSVCTFTQEETDGIIEPMLEEAPVDLEDGPEWMNKWKIKTGTYRTNPSSDGLDGFFLIRLRKRS